MLSTTLSIIISSPAHAQTQLSIASTQTNTYLHSTRPKQRQSKQLSPDLSPDLSPEISIRYNPPNRGAPGDVSTADAGSRSCGLMVFGPAQSHWGETLLSHPSFWLYSSSSGTITFDLADEETAEVIYQGRFETANSQVITQYTVPETAVALNIEQAYRWSFTLDCPGDPDPSANGIIVRRDASESPNLDLSNPDSSVSDSPVINSPDLEPTDHLSTNYLANARQLATNGFWFDAIDTLNQIRLSEASTTEPSSIEASATETLTAATQDWLSLLRQGGWEETLGDHFEQVATAPLSKELSVETSSTLEPATEVNQ